MQYADFLNHFKENINVANNEGFMIEELPNINKTVLNLIPFDIASNSLTLINKKRKKSKKEEKMYEEGYARQTFLCCIFMEIQRIIKEIDSKIIFIKNQRNNVDVSTFLYMNQIYQLYMKNELIANLEYLCNSPSELSTKPIITLLDKDAKKIEPLKLEPFIDKQKLEALKNHPNKNIKFYNVEYEKKTVIHR